MSTERAFTFTPSTDGVSSPPKPPRPLTTGFGDGGMLSPEDFQARLGVSRAQFFRLRSSGRLPDAVMFGRLPRWPIREIEAWEEARCPCADEWRRIRKLWLGLDRQQA